MNGLTKMIEFLSRCEEKNVHYRLEKNSADSIMATCTVVGARIEIEFFEDNVWFSVFKGDEAAEVGMEKLIAEMKNLYDYKDEVF